MVDIPQSTIFLCETNEDDSKIRCDFNHCSIHKYVIAYLVSYINQFMYFIIFVFIFIFDWKEWDLWMVRKQCRKCREIGIARGCWD